MCQLGNLDMTQCSETIETVSLSSSVKVQENKTGSRTVVSKYRFRDTKLYGKLSLMEYYEQVRHKNDTRKDNKTYIPNFVGGSSKPQYPVTEGYARSVLLIYKPWHDKDRLKTTSPWKRLFYEFLQSEQCPQSVRISYDRAKLKTEQINNKHYREPTAREWDEEINGELYENDDEEIQNTVNLLSTFHGTMTAEADVGGYKFDRGLEYDWSQHTFEVSSVNQRSRSTFVLTIKILTVFFPPSNILSLLRPMEKDMIFLNETLGTLKTTFWKMITILFCPKTATATSYTWEI